MRHAWRRMKEGRKRRNLESRRGEASWPLAGRLWCSPPGELRSELKMNCIRVKSDSSPPTTDDAPKKKKVWPPLDSCWDLGCTVYRVHYEVSVVGCGRLLAGLRQDDIEWFKRGV